MNKINESEKTTSGQSEISTAKTSSKVKEEDIEKMNRENLYHWGVTREIMEIIRRRNKSPEVHVRKFSQNNITKIDSVKEEFFVIYFTETMDGSMHGMISSKNINTVFEVFIKELVHKDFRELKFESPLQLLNFDEKLSINGKQGRTRKGFSYHCENY